ncbi:hypothetical protein ACWGS9_32205, partial [Bradyrhizobium sp. Arg314]
GSRLSLTNPPFGDIDVNRRAIDIHVIYSPWGKRSLSPERPQLDAYDPPLALCLKTVRNFLTSNRPNGQHKTRRMGTGRTRYLGIIPSGQLI